jgi:hypothetical protein
LSYCPRLRENWIRPKLPWIWKLPAQNIAEAKTLLDHLIDMTTAAAEGEHT